MAGRLQKDRMPECLDDDEAEDNKELAATIQDNIYADLLYYLPEDSRDRPVQLVDHLEGLARLLRFLDSRGRPESAPTTTTRAHSAGKVKNASMMTARR